MAQSPAPPHRQIRALYDDLHITVYQAYSDTIADAALAAQRLDASPDFRTARMTWIKPSWCWMMYRCGYSHKDARQRRVLALTMRRPDFDALLARAILSDQKCGDTQSTEGPAAVVRVQWDPERSARLERLPYRSIQIGIPGCLSAKWAGGGIVAVEDVTALARELKRVLDEEPGVTDEQLAARGLLPRELPYPVSDAIVCSRIGMAA